MADDFGELEQVVLDRIEQERRNRIGDMICLVDPADGTLKMYSRAEIHTKIAARNVGRPYAVTFEPRLCREVALPPRRDALAVFGKILIASAAMIGGMAGFAYTIARVISWFGL